MSQSSGRSPLSNSSSRQSGSCSSRYALDLHFSCPIFFRPLTEPQSPPPPHSLLQTFLPIMPPHLARPLVTASRYFSLLSQTVKDGFLLIFLLGLVVILADHLA